MELEKAKSGKVYISSDTIVVLENQILGKPVNFTEGMEILARLSGKAHTVYSGIGIAKKGEVFMTTMKQQLSLSLGEKKKLLFI